MTTTISRRALLSAAMAAPVVRLPRPVRVVMYGKEGHTGEITGPLSRLPDVKLLAHVETGSDLAALIAREKPDVVAVTNDNGGRAAAILTCLERGVRVIAEKPFALNTADLHRIQDMVRQDDRYVGMLVPMRFDPQYRAMREVVRGGLIGEVMQVAAQKSYKAGKRAPWFLKRESYGGTIAWIGIHMIDLIHGITGRRIVQVSGLQTRGGRPGLGEMETATASLFKLDNGAVGTLRLDYFRSEKAPTHGDDRLRIAGSKGIVEYSEATGLTLMTEERPPSAYTQVPAQGSVFIDFLEHVFAGKPTELPLEEIWWDNEVTVAAQQAADQGIVVTFRR